MPTKQPNQSRNLTSALGDVPAQLTVYGVWLTGILIGIVLMLIVVLPGTLSNSKVTPSNLASADSTDSNQINVNKDGNGNVIDYNKAAAAGKQLFTTKCQICHQQGGTSAAGLGPRLDRSFNARDASYIHSIVRNGAYGNYSPVVYNGNPQVGMPFFKKTDDGVYTYYITDEELSKVIIYLRTIQQAPRGPVPVIPKS